MRETFGDGGWIPNGVCNLYDWCFWLGLLARLLGSGSLPLGSLVYRLSNYGRTFLFRDLYGDRCFGFATERGAVDVVARLDVDDDLAVAFLTSQDQLELIGATATYGNVPICIRAGDENREAVLAVVKQHDVCDCLRC